MASSESATVRHARLEDVPAILGLIRELADYEHEIDAVEATHEKLISTIAFAAPSSSSGAADTSADGLPVTEPTSPQKPARCLLVVSPETGAAVGLALYFYNYSTWRARPGIYLEDLFVQPAQRGRGYGRLLLARLAREVLAMDGGRLEWAVLKWNEPSIRFYEGIGAQMMSEWVGMRVDREGLAKLAGMMD